MYISLYIYIFYVSTAVKPIVWKMTRRRGWTHAGLKLQLLIQGGDACSLRRRSERNVFFKYYAEDVGEDGAVKTDHRRARAML